MAAPVRHLNPNLVQYISLVLILLCVFVLLSEYRAYQKKAVESAVRPQHTKTVVVRAVPRRLRVVYEHKEELSEFLEREQFDALMQERFEALKSLVDHHDLNLELTLSGNETQLAQAVRQLDSIPFPSNSVSYNLKPTTANHVSLGIKLVHMQRTRRLRVAL